MEQPEFLAQLEDFAKQQINSRNYPDDIQYFSLYSWLNLPAS
jgi:hypothetical protein